MHYTPTSLNLAIARINYKIALFHLEEGTIKGYFEAMQRYRINMFNYRNE